MVKPVKYKYISYSEMGRKCKINGTKKLVKNLYSDFPPYFIICTKHWVCCNSGACKKERGVEQEIERVKKLNGH
jgi:hypothetical protein